MIVRKDVSHYAPRKSNAKHFLNLPIFSARVCHISRYCRDRHGNNRKRPVRFRFWLKMIISRIILLKFKLHCTQLIGVTDTCKGLLLTQKFAGHRDLRATSRYTKVRDERVKQTLLEVDKKQSLLLI